MFAGWVDIKVGDLLLTAMLVLAPCMLLGLLRPEQALALGAMVGVFVPIVELLGVPRASPQKPDRAQIYESFLALLARHRGGRMAGAMMRRAIVNNLLRKSKPVQSQTKSSANQKVTPVSTAVTSMLRAYGSVGLGAGQRQPRQQRPRGQQSTTRILVDAGISCRETFKRMKAWVKIRARSPRS